MVGAAKAVRLAGGKVVKRYMKATTNAGIHVVRANGSGAGAAFRFGVAPAVVMTTGASTGLFAVIRNGLGIFARRGFLPPHDQFVQSIDIGLGAGHDGIGVSR